MSTVAAIGMQQLNGTIKAISCRYDGRIGDSRDESAVGNILLRNYKKIQLNELFKHGEVKTLGKSVRYTTFMPCADESDVKAFTDQNVYADNAQHELGADVIYLFKNGRWYVKNQSDFPQRYCIYSDKTWIMLDKFFK